MLYITTLSNYVIYNKALKGATVRVGIVEPRHRITTLMTMAMHTPEFTLKLPGWQTLQKPETRVYTTKTAQAHGIPVWDPWDLCAVHACCVCDLAAS